MQYVKPWTLALALTGILVVACLQWTPLGSWLGFRAPTGATNEQTPKRSLSERVQDVLIHSDQECQKSGDCESQICAYNQCVALSSATQSWMEAEIADAVRKLIAENDDTESIISTIIQQQFAQKDPYIMGKFIGMLGHLRNEQFLPLLKTLADVDIELIQVRAIISLGRMQDPDSLKPLQQLLHHPSIATALQAGDAMASYLAHPTLRTPALEIIVSMLKHEDHRMRRLAIATLGQSGERIPMVVKGLESVAQTEGDGYLRYNATTALAKLGAKE